MISQTLRDARRYEDAMAQNITPMERPDYRVGVPKKKKYKLLLNSDEERLGGWGNEIPAEIMAEKKPYHYKDISISFDLPPYGAAVFLF